jgi:hypothetical protein
MKIIRWLLPAVALVCLAATSACTPPPDARVAAQLQAGELVILAYVCEGYQVNMVQIYETEANGEGKGWEVGPPIGQTTYSSSAHTIVVRPFEVPKGWEVFDDSLTRLEAATRYDVAFGTLQGQDSIITFTVEQLEKVGDNVVWAGRTGSERAMREDQFQRRAARDCPT